MKNSKWGVQTQNLGKTEPTAMQPDPYDYDEDEHGNPLDGKGNFWTECDKCQGEGCYDQSESDPTDWDEDCCSDAPGTIYRCSECRGEGGWWLPIKPAEMESK